MSDMLKVQLGQLQAALKTTQTMRDAAEDQYRSALKWLHDVAEALLPVEWNELLREKPDADKWGPDELGAWIVKVGQAKLNRLGLMAGGDIGAELEALQAEVAQLTERLGQVQDDLAVRDADLQAATDQLSARDAELAQLRHDVVALRDREAVTVGGHTVETATGEVLDDTPAAPADGPRTVTVDLDRDTRALQAIGAQGLCLRTDVATAVGIGDASSGSARRMFDRLREAGLIEETRPKVEAKGRTPYLIRLTEKGQQEYHRLFSQAPVESIYDRLLARPKSAEHVMLNFQARDALLAAGADTVDLYPRPVGLSGGGTFDVDIVAVFDGKPIYVEAERGAKNRREFKWDNYARVTKDFYVIVPNKKVRRKVISELDLWAYRNDEKAHGVTLRVCQLSEWSGGDLWTFNRKYGLLDAA